MPLTLRTWLALLLMLPVAPASAGTEAFALDPVHTRVAFFVDHAGLSRAIGTFSGAHGSLQFDPEDWSTARLEVVVPLANLDLGDADWRDKVLEPAFLDAKGQPEARFVSTRVETTGENQARVTGQLSLRGVSREVVLDVRLNALKRHPVTFRRTAGFSASTRLSRRDFGITTWPNVIGDEVELQIEAEAIRDRNDTPSPAEDSADADQERR
jgi:polyisoprenoid-binding protein YceI